MKPIEWTLNHMPKSDDLQLPVMSRENVKRARGFHQSFPEYSVTPLQRLKALAEKLGVREVFVKDESYRFGLNAFKVLGGSFAMARYIAKELNMDVSGADYKFLTSEKLGKEFGRATFFTATDGNHGRGVAWAANRLGQKAVVRMPKGTVRIRYENIRKEGAEVTIEEMNYDDCVRLAAAQAAQTPRGVIVQDTAWDGYEEIPAWIMQGYGTMAMEAAEQLQMAGYRRPTHIFVQAGVGSLAGAVTGFFANLFPDEPPKVVIVEADTAACLYKGAVAGDGEPRAVGGDMPTIMAGLACGEANTISWDILRNHAAAFTSCPDWVSAKGMRTLAAPLGRDPKVVSGESGAVGVGLLSAMCERAEYEKLRQALGIDEHSVILLFSTEGDTDPENYRNIVWDGKYPSCE
jgi:diaminopropionate ammonia-lyase